MSNTDKQLAELEAEEKKLLAQQKKERDALKKRLVAVKKEIREEQRKLNERRAALLGHCMIQKFSSDPGRERGHAAGSRWLPVKTGRSGTVRITPQIDSCKRRLLKLFRGLSLFQDRLPYASLGGRRQYLWQPRGSGVAPEKQTVFFRLWMRLPDLNGTEGGRVLNGIACRWRASKSGRAILGCSRR